MTDTNGEALWPLIRFKLMYMSNGYGLGMKWSDVNELDLVDVREVFERLQEQLKLEAEAMEHPKG